jgi:hypothetical protein
VRLSQQKLKREDPNNCDPHELKVVYDHTRIASYRHLGVGNVGKRVRLLALEGYECCSAGGFPSNPILSGPRRTPASEVREVSTVTGSRRYRNAELPGGLSSNPIFFLSGPRRTPGNSIRYLKMIVSEYVENRYSYYIYDF